MSVTPSQPVTFDPRTLQFYSEEAPIYVAGGCGGKSRYLPSFLKLLAPHAQILELGCGGGLDAKAMLEQRFEVDATDGTPEIVRVALEAGPLSQWLHAGLVEAGFEAVLLETRCVKAALSAMTVKTDRRDARGIAQLLRLGWFRRCTSSLRVRRSYGRC